MITFRHRLHASRVSRGILYGLAVVAFGAAFDLIGISRAEDPLALQVGQKAPNFTLKDTDGQDQALSSYLAQGKTVVLEWFNPDCPFIKKHHLAHTDMIDLAKEYRSKGVVWLAINSGAPGMQGNGLDRNRTAKRDYRIDYPILLDESGRVGREYGAKTTPHMFVITPDGTLVYKGAIDDDRGPSRLGKTNYVKSVLEALFAGKPAPVKETQSYGCSVKYAAS